MRCTSSGSSTDPQKSTLTTSTAPPAGVTSSSTALAKASRKATRPSCALGGLPALARMVPSGPSPPPSAAAARTAVAAATASAAAAAAAEEEAKEEEEEEAPLRPPRRRSCCQRCTASKASTISISFSESFPVVVTTSRADE